MGPNKQTKVCAVGQNSRQESKAEPKKCLASEAQLYSLFSGKTKIASRSLPASWQSSNIRNMHFLTGPYDFSAQLSFIQTTISLFFSRTIKDVKDLEPRVHSAMEPGPDRLEICGKLCNSLCYSFRGRVLTGFQTGS